MDQAIYALRQKFIGSMDDDFNIAAALASLFQFTRRINKKIDQSGLSSADREKALTALGRVNSVLGIMNLEPRLGGANEEVEELIQMREKARKAGEWDKADDLREKLREMGVEVVDTKEGPIWQSVETGKSKIINPKSKIQNPKS